MTVRNLRISVHWIIEGGHYLVAKLTREKVSYRYRLVAKCIQYIISIQWFKSNEIIVTFVSKKMLKKIRFSLHIDIEYRYFFKSIRYPTTLQIGWKVEFDRFIDAFDLLSL